MGQNKRPSQAQQILDYMQSGESISPIQALDMFGCFRLASRILELRNMGHKIKSDLYTNQFGKTFAKYTLILGE